MQIHITKAAMIHSLFLINDAGDIFLEKHWKSVIGKSVMDYFFEIQSKACILENVPPVISTPHHYLINIYRNDIFFVAVTQSEVSPLFVIEFLHRVVDTFTDYFSGCSESIIKDQIVVVYELLEEMLDNGFPLATESNVLKELIKPPSIVRSVVNTVTGGSNVSSELPTGSLSNVPWRRTGVKYANNEIYFDVIEEIDCIIDKNGVTINAEIQGMVDCLSRLSGMPDLTMCLMNPRVLDDVSFHPCIRLKRWESEKILSFVPPDGNFRLLSYHITNSTISIPIYVKPSVSFISGSSGRFELTVGTKQTMGKTVENVVIKVLMPKQVLNCNLTPTAGQVTFDPVKKELTWEVGKVVPQKQPHGLRGNMSIQSGAPPPEETPVITVAFSVNTLAVSGLKVSRLDVYAEKYKPFKGVKYMTKAGKFQVRS